MTCKKTLAREIEKPNKKIFYYETCGRHLLNLIGHFLHGPLYEGVFLLETYILI